MANIYISLSIYLSIKNLDVKEANNPTVNGAQVKTNIFQRGNSNNCEILQEMINRHSHQGNAN